VFELTWKLADPDKYNEFFRQYAATAQDFRTEAGPGITPPILAS